MATFVLVHGGWHGAWCWDRVVPHLERQQHTVHAPTLTGLGERRQLLTPNVNLDTHINDVVDLVNHENLTDVILCGHSYGGMVATGVAAALGPQVAPRVVYLDAFVPANGDTLIELLGWPEPNEPEMPAPPAAFFGLIGEDAAWVDKSMTPHPSGSATQPIRLPDNWTPAAATYILATGWEGLPHFTEVFERARQLPNWTTNTIEGSHDLMIDRPEAVSQMLLASTTDPAVDR